MAPGKVDIEKTQGGRGHWPGPVVKIENRKGTPIHRTVLSKLHPAGFFAEGGGGGVGQSRTWPGTEKTSNGALRFVAKFALPTAIYRN